MASIKRLELYTVIVGCQYSEEFDHASFLEYINDDTNPFDMVKPVLETIATTPDPTALAVFWDDSRMGFIAKDDKEFVLNFLADVEMADGKQEDIEWSIDTIHTIDSNTVQWVEVVGVFEYRV